MTHIIYEDLRIICKVILEDNLSIEQWSEIEGDDMFQRGNYIGGFDATEQEFCFSVFIKSQEYWFQFSLDFAKDIAENKTDSIEVTKRS